MVACSSSEDDAGDEDNGALTSTSGVCNVDATYPNAAFAKVFPDNPNRKVGNFASWPEAGQPGAPPNIPADVIAPKRDPESALSNLASRFGSCAPQMKAHMSSKKPNVYVYFTGYGGAAQSNTMVDEPAVMKWINDRDPSGIIFSVSWNCPASQDAFCSTNAKQLSPGPETEEWKAFARSVKALQGDAQMQKTMAGIKPLLSQQSDGYDAALSHAMQLGAQLVDQILVADQGPNGQERFGKIHFIGYSMGAHAAADILVQDFTADGSTGYKWSRSGVCENGGDTCTVAELKKVNWSLGMGTSGWSQGMRAYTRDRTQPYAEYKNGGLLRIRDARFKNKLNVFNRRMDPTSTSDDTFQRAFGDVLFGDYNHYSHDYSLPMFVHPGFIQTLDAFLESKNPKDVTELGIYYDNAGLMDFDECVEGAPCAARDQYLAHQQNRSHQKIVLMTTAPVPTTDGVPRADRKSNRAVSFTAQGAQQVVLQSMDQEDLRGAVEMYYRPTAYDPGSPGKEFGLFTYGACAATDPTGELMPTAYISADGNLVFNMKWQGQVYEAKVKASAAKLAKDKWTHLAFAWDLPTESLTKPQADDATAAAKAQEMAGDVQKYGGALVWANGLRKPLATSYSRQRGQGKLRIYANGQVAVEAALGTADSTRDCLTAPQVLPGKEYPTGADGTYPPYMPYANVDASPQSDIVKANGQPIGKRCKAYSVRNVPVTFGCARAPGGVNAGGDMDELLLVYGPAREKYENISPSSGAPQNWPIGASYSADPFRVR